MENIEERLRRLEAADCKVCGFTVDQCRPRISGQVYRFAA